MDTIYDPDLVWRMQLKIREFLTYHAYEFVIPNLSRIYFCLPEIYNANISHQPFDYIITFVNYKHKCKRWFCTQKQILNVRFKDFWFTKINLRQKYTKKSVIMQIHSIFLIQNKLIQFKNALSIGIAIYVYRIRFILVSILILLTYKLSD